MKPNTRIVAAIAALIIAGFPMTTDAQPRLNVQLEFGAPPVSRYYVSLSESYGVPYNDVCELHEAGIDDEDMPSILYIYTHSQYSLRQIYSLRLRGATWEQLSSWCGVPLYRDHNGPPYGKAYGYYSHGPGREWNAPRHSDGEGNGHHSKWPQERHGRGRFQEDR